MNLPNKLTILRIILVLVMIVIPFFGIKGDVYGVTVECIILDLIFIIASITDNLDGRIARKRNLVTNFGKFLDPIADKILVITALIMLVEMGRLPAWIPSIVIFREFLVSGYRLVAAQSDGKVIAASIWGKIKTTTQMIAIILAFIDVNAYGAFVKGGLVGLPLVLNILTTVMMTVSVIAAIFSGWDYLKNGKDLLKDI